jgi:hypothetical protein
MTNPDTSPAATPVNNNFAFATIGLLCMCDCSQTEMDLSKMLNAPTNQTPSVLDLKITVNGPS